ELLVLREAPVEQFQRHAAPELQVLRAVDVGHPPGADAVEHAVALVHHRVAGDAVDAHLPSASSTCLAIGAATTPPWPPWTRSSTTAIAKSLGKPMKQGSWILRWMSISAVPVLPASSTPSSAAAVPVPSLTTCFIIPVNARAVSTSMTRSARLGSISSWVRPSGSTIFCVMC